MTDAKNLKVAIVVSRYNEFITKRLLEAAVKALEEFGARIAAVDTFRVPGCFELPLALAEVADRDYDAAVCLGVVIRGETAHFDFVAGECARGIARISVEKRLPVGFGVITAETTDQAIDRSGGKRGNKGREAALAAVEMVDMVNAIRQQ